LTAAWHTTKWNEFDARGSRATSPYWKSISTPVTTNNGHFAYTSNVDSQMISGYAIGHDRNITLLNANRATGTPLTLPIEALVSRNSRFLYVLHARLLLLDPSPSMLSGLRVVNNGQPDFGRRSGVHTLQRHRPDRGTERNAAWAGYRPAPSCGRL
jgi:hypothetical protein